MDKCSFCGSKDIKIKTPYLDRFGEVTSTFCCLAQRKNQKYIETHTSRMTGDKPENVDKW